MRTARVSICPPFKVLCRVTRCGPSIFYGSISAFFPVVGNENCEPATSSPHGQSESLDGSGFEPLAPRPRKALITCPIVESPRETKAPARKLPFALPSPARRATSWSPWPHGFDGVCGLGCSPGSWAGDGLASRSARPGTGFSSYRILTILTDNREHSSLCVGQVRVCPLGLSTTRFGQHEFTPHDPNRHRLCSPRRQPRES